MKKHVFIKVSALLAFFIALTAFIVPGNIMSKDLPTEKFSKVSIAIKAKVYIEQGENYKLDIQTDEKTLEKINVEFSTDGLEIECKHGCNIDEPVVIYITAPSLTGISVAGSAELYIEKGYDTKEMELSIAGSGFMNLNKLKAEEVSASVAGSGKLVMNELTAREVEASVAGSGNVVLSGNNPGSEVDLSIAGSGSIDAAGFEAAEVKVEIAGSGDCKVFASKKLNASIAGSGSILYKGSPEIEKETAGSGKVKKMDGGNQ
jgi:hypothetical protein